MLDGQKIKINYMIHRKTFPGWEILPRYISDYELVLILSGQGYIQIEQDVIPVSTGDLICFRPGVKHSLWVAQAPYMAFYGLHFELSAEDARLPFPHLMHLDAPLRLELFFRQLYECYTETNALYIWRQKLILQQLLCEIFILLQEQEEPMSIRRVRKTLEYIHENLNRRITLEDLIVRADLRKTMYIKVFHNITGTTPIQYILRQRLENAKDLLTSTGLSVVRIAEECGFEDSFYFSRCFRRHFTMSPTEYRKLHRIESL